jgi:hypothetical protein
MHRGVNKNPWSEAIFPNINQTSLCSLSNLQFIFRMIVPWKIVVCSLKSVKRLTGVQNDSLVLNTLRSLDSPVMNTTGSQFLDVFEQASEQVYKKNL